MPAYFERLASDRYLPTPHAGGAWNDTEIHFSPLGGLIMHAIDLHRAEEGADSKQMVRISFDILGFLASEECVVTVQTIRPGRTIELVEAVVSIRGRAAVMARAWFMGLGDTAAIEGGAPEAMPGPDAAMPWDFATTWQGGFIASLESRVVEPPRPGRGRSWLHSDTAIVDGEEASAHATFIALADTANGLAMREPADRWVFPNLDLTIHLYRQPEGAWTGLDTSAVFGPAGHGLTSTTLHDVRGPVGRAEQILTVRPAG